MYQYRAIFTLDYKKVSMQYTKYNARSIALELNHFYGRFVYVHFFTFIQ